ncbi:MAG: acyltransferase family protein [Flavobacteriales bacterium]
MKNYLPSLNGIRAISILLVISNHLFSQHYDGNPYLTSNRILQLLTTIFIDGQLGVNMFFVLSGFLITTLLLEEEQLSGTISIKDFYVRRMRRIFPAYYFLLLVYFVLRVVTYLTFPFIWISYQSWITSLTFTKYFNYGRDSYTGHLWSLAVEMHFYILWPLIFKWGSAWRKKILIGVVLLLPFLRLYLWYNPNEWMQPLSIFTRFDALVIGCLFAVYKTQIWGWMNNYQNTVFFLSLMCLTFMSYFSTLPYALEAPFCSIDQSVGSTRGTIANVAMGCILLYSLMHTKGWWYQLLNSKIMIHLGVLSFSLYLWQQLFLSSNDYWINIFPVNIALIYLTALFSYHFIEKPLRPPSLR